MLKAQYTERGPIPQNSITAVEFDAPALAEDEALVGCWHLVYPHSV